MLGAQWLVVWEGRGRRWKHRVKRRSGGLFAAAATSGALGWCAFRRAGRGASSSVSSRAWSRDQVVRALYVLNLWKNDSQRGDGGGRRCPGNRDSFCRVYRPIWYSVGTTVKPCSTTRRTTGPTWSGWWRERNAMAARPCLCLDDQSCAPAGDAPVARIHQQAVAVWGTALFALH